MDFHKERSISYSYLAFNNIFTDSLNDEIKHIPDPNINVSEHFSDVYIKQVMAVVLNNKLLESEKIMQEAKEKALQYLRVKNFNVGAYSDSKGILLARKNIAKWYMERDGYKIDENEIYLINGAINAYDHILSLVSQTGDCVMVPSPSYPIYSRFNTSFGVENIYYGFEGIQEGNPTRINFKDLTDNFRSAKAKGKSIKALLVINPHSPTGRVMTEDEIVEVIKFCEANRLLLIVNESLQNSIYPKTFNGNIKNIHSHQIDSEVTLKNSEGNVIGLNEEKKFISFRHVMNKINSPLEMFSFFSISKGPFFNGAARAGILDHMNIDEEVTKQLYKYKSIDLCSSVPGQIFIDLSLNKPKEFGYEFLFKFEKSLNSYNQYISDLKKSIYELIKQDKDIKARDIEAGFSFFVQSKNNTDKKFLLGENELKVNSGIIYGPGLENYININIESNFI